MIVRELAALLSLKVDQGGFKAADRLFDQIGKSLAVIGLGVGGLLSGGAAIGAISGAIDTVATSTAHLAKTAPQLGMATAELQNWEHAAKATGGSAEDIQAAAEHVGSLFNAANMGSTHAVMALAKFGVSARKASGEAKTFAEIFEGVATSEKFTKAPDGLKLSTDFREVFGGTGLLALARKNAEERAELLGEVAAFGATFTKEDLASAAAYRRELSRTSLVMLGLKQSVGGPLTQTIATATKQFNEWVKATGGSNAKAARTGFEQSAKWAGALAKAMEWVYRAGTFAMQWIDGIAIAALSIVAIPLIGWIASVVTALATGGLVAIAPWALLIVGFIALGIAIDEVWTLLQGGETVIGRFFPNFAAKVKEIAALFQKGNWEEAFNQIGLSLLRAFDDIAIPAIKKAWNGLIEFLGTTVERWWQDSKVAKVLMFMNPATMGYAATRTLVDTVKGEGIGSTKLLAGGNTENPFAPKTEKDWYSDPSYRTFVTGLRAMQGFDAIRPGPPAADGAPGGAPQRVNVEIKIEGVSDPVLAAQEAKKRMEEFYQEQAGPLWNPR